MAGDTTNRQGRVLLVVAFDQHSVNYEEQKEDACSGLTWGIHLIDSRVRCIEGKESRHIDNWAAPVRGVFG